MPLKKIIKTTKEYDLLVSILKNEKFENFEGSRHQIAWLGKKAVNFILINEKLYLFCKNGNHKKVISYDNRDVMFQEVLGIHMSTHFGQNKMEEICGKLFFSIPRSIVREVVNGCFVCKQARPLKEKKSKKHIIAKFPFERVQVDCVDLHKYSGENDGYKWIMTVVDVYSKFAFVYPLKSKFSQEIKKCLENLVHSEGAFKILQTDNGLEFKNSKVDELCHNYFIERIYGRPRHPQSQGIVERFNQTVTRYLQKNLFGESEDSNKESKRWIDLLESTVYNYNISVHESTKKSPFALFKNRDGFNTCFFSYHEIDVSYSLKDHEEAKINQRRYFETKLHDKNEEINVTFKIGDIVIVKKDFDNNVKTKKQKLGSFYDGPFEVRDILENNVLFLKSDEKEIKITGSTCKHI